MATTEETKTEATTTEEVVATTTEKADEEKTVEELKAEAEALEQELKALKEQKGEDEVKQNQLRRLQKAREKKEALLNSQPEEKQQKTDEVDVRDLLTLSKQDIPEDSEQAKVLKRYKDAGIIKSYAEGLEHVGVKAELDAINARNNAKAIIDENADEETRLKSTKEVIKQYQTSGEIPQDPKLQAELARENLKSMGL